MSKSLSQTTVAPRVNIAEVVKHGEQLILPEQMSIDDAIELLGRRKAFEQEEVIVRESYEVFPWDGANAFNDVLMQRYGWAQAIATPGFFGPNPPQMLTIEVAPNVFKQVPWGRFSLPNIEGFVQSSSSRKDGRIVFELVAKVIRRDEATVKALFDQVRIELREHSIYRGQAVKIRFRDNAGAPLEMPEPKFLDTKSIKPESLIYSADVQASIETNLFTPILRCADCLANGIPVKRGVLLGGVFGTGKTLAAHVASKHAVDNGITYLYVPRADELADAIEFAKQYQSPACVIFVEDIDRAMSGDRSVKMDDILNIIDGIDTKRSNIIVVMTTNDMDAINPAMLRPGRLDAVIEVLPPDAEAVQKLLRLYGADAIDSETDLTTAGTLLAGNIPAVIAEVVKRAKLSQLRLQPPGEPVRNISDAALVDAAKTMRQQIDILRRAAEGEKAAKPTLDTALATIMADAIENHPVTRQVKEIRSWRE